VLAAGANFSCREKRGSERSISRVVPPHPPRAPARFRSILAWALGFCTLLTACSVQLIAAYDEYTVRKTADVHELCESLFLAIEKAASTPEREDDLYPKFERTYDQIVVGLRVLEVRAAALERNEITVEQVHGWLESMLKIQDLHRAKSAKSEGFSADAISVLREPIAQQVRSILVLQLALKRGK